MSGYTQEWLNLLVRLVHVIAAIMWIGDSFLFMWMDSHLTAPLRPREGDVVGELWMTHSGGFYEVVKRKSLGQDELPPQLHWFKWESYTTWISGFLLLVVVYQLGGAAMLVDPAVAAMTQGQAVHRSLAVLVGAVVVYDLLWRTPLGRYPRVFAAVGYGLLVALGYGLTHVFAGRAAFLLMGAAVGTVMASNVFFRIIPAQKHMLAATRAGTPVDTRYGLRAKGRSIQNHYLTLPVLLTMLSNHFPSLYSGSRAWFVLALIFLFGASLKYLMNLRARSHPAVIAAALGSFCGAAWLAHPPGLDEGALLAYRRMPVVSFATAQSIVQTRCVSCHAAHPTNPGFAAPPSGVVLETPAQMASYAERIFERAVATRTMPLGNLTGITEDERAALGAWVAQGADLHAAGPVAIPTGLAPTAPVEAAPATPRAFAAQRYATLCASCHGEHGDGEGPTGRALPVRPRNFTDAAWQASVTDEQLAKVILLGGAAVGKNALMPGNPDLEGKPEVIAELVKRVRGYRK